MKTAAKSEWVESMTQPNKGEPVAGTATPLTDALRARYATDKQGWLWSSHFDGVLCDTVGTLESALTLAREKIAVQAEQLRQMIVGKAHDDQQHSNAIVAISDRQTKELRELRTERDTARASLAAVTAKMQEIREVCAGVNYDGLVGKERILSIITQEEAKP